MAEQSAYMVEKWVIMFKAKVFLVVTPRSVAVGYQCFGGSCCLHHQGNVNGAGKRSKDTDMEFIGGRGAEPDSK
jgi:hypothetical protein